MMRYDIYTTTWHAVSVVALENVLRADTVASMLRRLTRTDTRHMVRVALRQRAPRFCNGGGPATAAAPSTTQWQGTRQLSAHTTTVTLPQPSVLTVRHTAVAGVSTRGIKTSTAMRQADEPDLSFDDHLEIVNQHLDLLSKNNKFSQGLKQVKEQAGTMGIVERWNAAAAIYAMSLAHSLAPYGFTPDINSLQQYQEQQDKMCRKHEHGDDIEKFNRERLLVLVETAFGIELPEETDVNLSTVRQAWGMLSMKMDSDDFEAAVKKAMDAIPSSASEDETQALKFQALQVAVLNLQKDVAESFNLTGDEGFIKLQVAFMEYQTDDQVRYTASMAYHKAFNKFGLGLPGMDGK
eukprot:m.161265 g.161265  ORF g.161265 m.161265 type:complete len:351 (-) comp12054_c0_seq1:66-1118(-)